MTKQSKNSLDKLKEQRDKLTARIQKKEALLKNTERKKEMRRKILIGSYFLDQAIEKNKMDEIKSFMNTYLKRNSDRELFDLELLTNTK